MWRLRMSYRCDNHLFKDVHCPWRSIDIFPNQQRHTKSVSALVTAIEKQRSPRVQKCFLLCANQCERIMWKVHDSPRASGLGNSNSERATYRKCGFCETTPKGVWRYFSEPIPPTSHRPRNAGCLQFCLQIRRGGSDSVVYLG